MRELELQLTQSDADVDQERHKSRLRGPTVIYLTMIKLTYDFLGDTSAMWPTGGSTLLVDPFAFERRVERSSAYEMHDYEVRSGCVGTNVLAY